MDKSKASRKKRYAPAKVGKVIGGAFALGLAILLSFRATWIYFLIAFSPVITPLPILLVFAGIIAIGAAVGSALARAGFVPPLHRFTALAIGFIVAFAPLATGFAEVVLRGPPVSLPSDVKPLNWYRAPWGDQLLYLESDLDVPMLHARLVESAKDAGWNCRYCKYQPSTGTGHANLVKSGSSAGQSGGKLGFEIWPGEMALYGTAPSPLTQVRMFHQQRTWSIEWASLVIFAVLVLGMIHSSRHQRMA